MLSRITENVVLLFPLIDLTLSAMVLPRPPSSPNHIRHDYNHVTGSFREKASPVVFLHDFEDKPNLIDVKLLEVQVQNLEGSPGFDENPDSPPRPEVISHSMFGVRNIEGYPSRFQVDKFPNLRNFEEKLYYLKPTVDVNVRGHSGSFRKDGANVRTTTGNAKVAIMRPFREAGKSRKSPKKFQREQENADEEFSTTENPFVITSSELPRQIPAPPSKVPARYATARTTTPIFGRRTEVYPYFSEAIFES